jgi:ABC-type multidrug transport system fused ATPase/permease subunit
MTSNGTPSRRDQAAWLIRQTRPLLPNLALSVLARIAGQLLGVALLVIVAAALGRAAAGEAVSIGGLVGTLVLVALAKASLRYLEHYAGHWVAFTALARLRELFFARLVPQAPAATQGRAGAELTQRATRDIDRIEVFFAHTMPPAAAAIVVPAIALGWLATAVDARLAAVLLPFVAAVVLLVPFASSRSAWRSAQAVAARRGQLARRLGDDIQGVREVLGFGLQDRRLAGLDAADEALASARSRAGVVEAIRAAAVVVLEAGGLVALVALGSAAAVPAPQVAIALAVAVGVRAPARGMEAFVSGLDAAFAATARIRQMMDAQPLVRDPDARESTGPTVVEASATTPAVEFADVTFGYPRTGRPVLSDVSLGFAAGSWSCVVGVSGSGKSTLAGLLLRGWDVDQGAVRLHGTDVRQLSLDELRRRVAFVPQRSVLLSGTLADNLRLAAPAATEDELRDALAVAGLDTWVDQLPNGLASQVRERGLNLSGGQLQRLTLARALVARPEVLVLDEALSQLDAATARLVRERLARWTDLTIIEITHRADLVRDDTPTVVLDAGRVVESGRAGDLRARGGAFVRLEARETARAYADQNTRPPTERRASHA